MRFRIGCDIVPDPAIRVARGEAHLEINAKENETTTGGRLRTTLSGGGPPFCTVPSSDPLPPLMVFSFPYGLLQALSSLISLAAFGQPQ